MKKWQPSTTFINHYGVFEGAVHNKWMLYVEGFFKERPVSAVMVGNMSYMLVTQLIMTGRIRRAEHTEEYRDWLREEMLGKERGAQ